MVGVRMVCVSGKYIGVRKENGRKRACIRESLRNLVYIYTRIHYWGDVYCV